MRSAPIYSYVCRYLGENGELLLPVRIFGVCVLHATQPQHGRRTCVVAVSLVLSLASCGIRQRFRVDKFKMRQREEGWGAVQGCRGEGVNQLQTDCMRQSDGCFLTSISICDLFACISHLQTATATASASASANLLPLTSTE